MVKSFSCCAIATLATVLLTTLVYGGEPIVVARGAGKQVPKQPQAVLSADGVVHVAYGVGDQVYYCRSTDAGKSFTAGKAAFSVPNMSLGMRRGPRIAVSKEEIVVSAIGGEQGKGRDGDILAWRSRDEGESWQGPVRVNDVVASAREGLHALAAGEDGTLWCTWLDLRNKRTELYASRSTDGGRTWSENSVVYQSPDGSICECCHPSIAIHDGAVHVLFRNSVDGNRDMYLASSVDGRRFQSRRLGDEHWQLDACPMDGGMLSVDGDGKVFTVWRRGGLVYATREGQQEEILLGRGEQPWVASTGRVNFAVWTGARQGELFITSLAKIEPRSIATLARDPVIATSPQHSTHAVVLWESKKGDAFTIEATTIDLPAAEDQKRD